jgi:hypothetical protein
MQKNRLRKDASFSDWLDACLARPLPTEVVALLFNISPRELNACVELTGTSEFSLFGREWTWAECWDPDQSAWTLPFSPSSETKTWHRHADFIRNELVHYIKNGTYRHRLDRIDGVALEVAEGEAIELLWQRSGNARTQARTQAQGSNR